MNPAVRLLELFQGREGFYAELIPRVGHWMPVAAPLAVEAIEAHVRGERVLGSYVLLADSTCRYCTIDLDTDETVRAELNGYALPSEMVVRKLRRIAGELGVPREATMIVFSGAKGHHLHVFFGEPVSGADARRLLGLILARVELADSVSAEIFPKQDSVPSEPMRIDANGEKHYQIGNLVKLPLAHHHRTGHVAEIIDPVLVKPMSAALLATILGGHAHEKTKTAGKVERLIPEGPPPEGRRHDTLISVAGTLRYRNLEEGVILAALRGVNAEKCSSSKPDDELVEMAAFVAAKEPGECGGSIFFGRGEPVAASPEAPAFPLHGLPDAARAYIEKLAEGGIPLEYLGPSALGVMAGALGGLVGLEIAAETWIEPLILWYALVGKPGTAKSPALAALRVPLDEIEGPWFEAYRDQIVAWKKLTPNERREKPRPQRHQLLLGNHTFEKLIRVLAVGANRAGLMLIADEIRSVIAALGQYKRGGGSDRPDFLSLWSAHPISYARVTDDLEIYVRRPTVSIVGGLQPAMLNVLDGDDGLRDRFCLSWRSVPAAREVPEIVKASKEAEAWAELVRRLAKKRDLPRTRGLDDDAHARFQDARQRLRDLQINPETPEHLTSWAAKAPSHLARHALLLAEIDGRGQVDADSMEGAEALIDYFAGQMRALPISRPNLMLAPLQRGQDEAVDHLAEFLRQQPTYRATKREVQRARVAGTRTTEDLARLVQRYGATFPGCVVEETAGGQPRQVLFAPGKQPS